MEECNNYKENMKREKIRRNGCLLKDILTWVSRCSFILLNISLLPLALRQNIPSFDVCKGFELWWSTNALGAAVAIPHSL